MAFKKSFKIGSIEVGNNFPVFIIAEIGVNHNGDVQLAKKMIDEAAVAGVNAVKFQAFYPDELVDINTPKAEYQLETTDKEESQYEMLKRLRLSKTELKYLKDYTEKKGLIFLVTPFDEKSFFELEELNVVAYKISSTDVTNLLFLKRIAATHKPIILSTGMASMDEIAKAVDVIYNQGNEQLILLHCTANYPTAIAEVNMKAIYSLKEQFYVLVGYSDHTEGIGIAPYTIPLDVKVVEKHFTLDKKMEGPDHRASIEPDELKEFVEKIRYVETALGDGIKKPTKSELGNKKVMQKKIVVTSDIEKGTIITEQILSAKRARDGISAIHVFDLIGKTINRNIKKGEIIYFSDLDE